LCLWRLLLYYSRPIYPESFKKFRSAVCCNAGKGGGPLKLQRVSSNHMKLSGFFFLTDL
jgi:hypothetical protein